MKYLILSMTLMLSLAHAGAKMMDKCPDKPNCVSSLSDRSDDHYIEALPGYDLIMDKIRTYIEDQENWSIVKDEADYIHAIQKSRMMGFIDDIEFSKQGDVVHVRSASRSGYYDFGVNRKRVEKIREYLK